jgi:hypothetical protein
MNMMLSSLLPPFIVLAGEFGKTLMRKYAVYKRSRVVLTPSPWMTSETTLMYLAGFSRCSQVR